MNIGDKIRKMSNEELVSVFMEAGHDFPQYCNPVMEALSCDYDCRKCCLEWLNKEIN